MGSSVGHPRSVFGAAMLRKVVRKFPGRSVIAFVVILLGPALVVCQVESKNATKAKILTAEAQRLRSKWTASASKSAISRYAEALKIWRALRRQREEADVLIEQGSTFLTLSRYREALDAFVGAQQIYSTLKTSHPAAAALSSVADVYLRLGNHQQAKASAQQAIILNSPTDPRIRAAALNVIADAAHFLSDFEAASKAAEEAASLSRTLSDPAGEARALGRQASLLGDNGRLAESVALHQLALSLWRRAGDLQGEAMSLNNIGSQLTFKGDYQRSLEYHDKALILFERIGDRKGSANVLGNVGWTHFILGDMDNALFHFERAAKLYSSVGNQYYEATMIACIGDVHLLNGDNYAALEKYKKSLTTMQLFEDKQWQALILNSLGAANLNLSRYDEARNAYVESISFFQKLPNKRWEANSLTGLGSVYLAIRELRKARECFKNALSLSEEVGDLSGESLARAKLARLELESGNLNVARSEVEAALQINENIRSRVVSQQSRTSYLASVHENYELYVDTLMRLHQLLPSADYAVRALEASERGRARTLVEMLVESAADIRAGVDPTLLKREEVLSSQLAAEMQRQLPLTGRQRESKQLEITTLALEYQNVHTQIRTASRAYAALKIPPSLTVAQMKQLLDEDTVLLVYALGNRQSFVWVVTPDSVVVHVLPERARIEEAARRTYALLTMRNEVNDSGSSSETRIAAADNEYVQHAWKLSEMVFAPFQSDIKGKRLVVISDGALQYIPFAGLPLAAPQSRGSANVAPFNFVGDQHEILNLPSASVLAVQRQQTERQGTAAPPITARQMAIFADPVFDRNDSRVVTPSRIRDTGFKTVKQSAAVRSHRSRRKVRDTSDSFARSNDLGRVLRDVGLNAGRAIPRLTFSRREAEAISALSQPGQVVKMLDFQASRTSLNQMDLSRFGIVHFATHGLLDNQHPESSGILLSLVDEAGRRQEGFLNLEEIYRLRLKADLVVLSACQTALGKDIRGEGLVGLTRGFMYAGAARVVSTLWKVDDSATAELMGEFYRQMFINKKRPPEALKEAQLYISKQKRWRSPYYWAGFVLQGEWR